MTDHERQVLGAMLTSQAAIDDVTAILTGKDFAHSHHEQVFDAIVAHVSDGQPLDVVAIGDRIEQGRTYLHELVGGLVTASSAGYHAEKVRDASRLRKVREVGMRLETLANTDGDPLDVVNAARAELDAVLSDDDADDSHEAAVYAAIETLEEEAGMPTAWRVVTEVIGGWRPGMLYIIGARPGIGKTVLGIGAVVDSGRRNQTSIMFSLEMPKSELYLRMLSASAEVDGDRLTHRRLTDADHHKLAEAAAHISRLPLIVDDRSALSLAQMRAKIRAAQRNGTVGLVVVDYLGLVKPPADAPRNDRRVQVDAIAQGLKNLARDLRVPVIALAQLNRGIEGRQDKAPTLSDLRESGGIEAAADVVILMHRDAGIHDAEADPTDLRLSFAKNRHGPQAGARLIFQGQFSRALDPLTSRFERNAS